MQCLVTGKECPPTCNPRNGCAWANEPPPEPEPLLIAPDGIERRAEQIARTIFPRVTVSDSLKRDALKKLLVLFAAEIERRVTDGERRVTGGAQFAVPDAMREAVAMVLGEADG